MKHPQKFTLCGFVTANSITEILLDFVAPMPLSMLTIIVNDAERSVPQGTSVEVLLGLLGLKPRFLAVELNRRVVPRGEHPQTILVEGDQLEIVTLVGGG